MNCKCLSCDTPISDQRADDVGMCEQCEMILGVPDLSDRQTLVPASMMPSDGLMSPQDHNRAA